jgi:threonine synthase
LAARAAASGVRAVVIVPEGVEPGKLAAAAVHGATIVEIRGDYDRANRLSIHLADRYGWGVVNVNLRAFYTEGAKTVGFEIVEQLGGVSPGHVVAPVAGGGLFVKLAQSFREAVDAGLAAPGRPTSLHVAQAAGCAPVVEAWRDGRNDVRPVKPKTILHSIAVGDPSDGARALHVVRTSGGRADAPSDEEAVGGVRLLAETEGLFVETAGGLVVAAAGRLAREGAFSDGRAVVLVITGHGLKTADQLSAGAITRIDGSAESFDAYWKDATEPTRSGTAAD